MKKAILLLTITSTFIIIGCKPVQFTISAGNGTLTNVNVNQSNFKNLGTFYGTATAKKVTMSIKERVGLGTEAKLDLINNAKKAGVELTGSRMLTNIIIDKLETGGRITISMSGDIIEFNK